MEMAAEDISYLNVNCQEQATDSLYCYYLSPWFLTMREICRVHEIPYKKELMPYEQEEALNGAIAYGMKLGKDPLGEKTRKMNALIAAKNRASRDK